MSIISFQVVLRAPEGALTPFPSLFLPNLLRPNLLRPEIHLHCSIHGAERIVAVSAPLHSSKTERSFGANAKQGGLESALFRKKNQHPAMGCRFLVIFEKMASAPHLQTTVFFVFVNGHGIVTDGVFRTVRNDECLNVLQVIHIQQNISLCGCVCQQRAAVMAEECWSDLSDFFANVRYIGVILATP